MTQNGGYSNSSSAHYRAKTLDLTHSPLNRNFASLPSVSTKTKGVSSWNTDDVLEWLRKNGFKKYMEGFRHAQARGKDLARLTAYDLETKYRVSKIHSRKMVRLLGGMAPSPRNPLSAANSPRNPSSHKSQRSLNFDTARPSPSPRSGGQVPRPSPSPSSGGQRTIAVLLPSGSNLTLSLKPSDTAGYLRERVSSHLKRNGEPREPDDLVLSYNGEELEEDEKLQFPGGGKVNIKCEYEAHAAVAGADALLEKHAETWDGDDVSTWLRWIGMERYDDSFRDKNVQGRHLLKMSKRKLDSILGVGKIHIRKMMREVKHLQRKWKGKDKSSSAHSRSKSVASGADLQRQESKRHKRSKSKTSSAPSGYDYNKGWRNSQVIAMTTGDDIAMPEFDFDDPAHGPKAYGTGSGVRCPQCGTPSQAHDKFCRSCGNNLAAKTRTKAAYGGLHEEEEEEDEEEDEAPSSPFMPGVQVEIQGLKGRLTTFNGKNGVLLKKIEEGVWSGLRVWSVQVGKQKCKIKEQNLRIRDTGGVGFIPRHVLNDVAQRSGHSRSSSAWSPSEMQTSGSSGVSRSKKKKKKKRGHSRSRSHAPSRNGRSALAI